MNEKRKAENSYKGILSAVLKKTEKENGFGEVSYAWGVSAEAFLTNLKSRRPFKDYSASVGDHGEYTHRIQWWILCNLVLPTSGNNAKYYEECAEWACELADRNNRKVYLWDFLFDSATNTTGLTDIESYGRSPIYVFAECRSEDNYPLLATFLNYRVAKATIFNYDIVDSKNKNVQKLAGNLLSKVVPPGILERAARRFLNKSFGGLKSDEQTMLHDMILEKGFTNHWEDAR